MAKTMKYYMKQMSDENRPTVIRYHKLKALNRLEQQPCQFYVLNLTGIGCSPGTDLILIYTLLPRCFCSLSDGNPAAETEVLVNFVGVNQGGIYGLGSLLTCTKKM